MKVRLMVFEVNFASGEHEGFSCKVVIGDRTYYIKRFFDGKDRFFSCDFCGSIEKEISESEFNLWLGIMTDSEQEAQLIREKISLAKKY
jgi:hypothetical protein